MSNGVSERVSDCTRADAVSWLVRFVGYVMLAMLGTSLVAGLLAALVGMPLDAAVVLVVAVNFFTVALMCTANDGPRRR